MLYMQVRAGLAIAVFGLFGRSLGALGPVAHLPIANKIIAPDGFTRDTVLAGGQFPGPLIAATKGDNFRITVIDQLKNATLVTPTSIHWHGLFQHTTAWADGPAFVTQCPIVTGDSFLYNFNAPGQAGTFWYHSHISTQYCDGLRGPLVIYDPEDPYKHLYDVDDESTIITLGDWYHLPAAQVPVPARSDSTVINGLGRFLGGPLSPLAVIDVVYGKRYRFRLLNVACNPNYIFSIDGHNMTIIEADGQNTHPVTVDSLQIFVAQRYSFILEANQPVGNYWIRANPNEPAQMGFANGINSAILRYHGAPDEEPTTTQPTSVALLKETDLHPLENPAAPGKPHPGGGDVNLNLNLGFNNQTGLFSINGAPFVPPTVPVMLQILSGNVKAQSLLPPGSVYNLPLNSVIEVSIPGGVVNEEHPFHLHGHAFSVVRSAGTTKYNYVNPVRRDTVNIGLAGDNVTIRFVTDNPGPWFLHCHIDFHLVAGLAIVFAEDAPDIAAVNPVPEAWKELCPKYDASLNH